MTITSVEHLTPVQKTIMVTLKGRAVDAESERPILADPVAARVASALPYDLSTVRLGTGVDLAITLRSALLDLAVQRFLQAHPDAVVVELGCGLDTRHSRLNPPATVAWYDIDYQEVIELRTALLPPPPGVHPVAGSLTDSRWMDGIPGGRPVILVADGVLPFLSEDDNRALLAGITDHFAGGELIFNAYPRLVAKLMGRQGVLRSVGLPKTLQGYGFDDPREVERLEPRMRFRREEFGVQAPQVAGLSLPIRLLAKLFGHWKAQARRGVWVVHYAFGPDFRHANHGAVASG